MATTFRTLQAKPTADSLIKPAELVDIVEMTPLTLTDRRIYNLLIEHAWDTIDYDLTQFGSTGPDDANFLPVRIEPTRVELSEMFGSTNKRVWRA